MSASFLKCAVLLLVPATGLLADFSYEQSSQITGGLMAGAMKLAGAFSRQAGQPIKATVAVKGDRMVHATSTHASLIDLAKETITEIDFQKKTYTVMTFAEMTRMIEEASKKTQSSNDPNMNVKVSVSETGQTRNIAGHDTKEVVLKIVMESQDPKSGQKGAFTVTSDMWLAPDVAGYAEVTGFQKRMAEKIAWAPGGNAMAMGRSDMAKAMAEAVKEGAKLNGVPVHQVMSMGGAAQPGAEGAGAPAPQQEQQPQQQQRQVEPPAPSAGGALGGALGRLGGLGGLRRKKQDQPAQQPPQEQAPAAQQQPAQASPAASGALMEMTTDLANFSTAAVDPSKFEIPAGFKQVQTK